MPTKSTKGFTLIEQIAVVAVLLVVITIVGGGLHTVFTTYTLQRQILDDQFYIRMALLNLTRDINHRDQNTPVFLLPTPSPSQLGFTSANGNTIVYELGTAEDGNWLTRTVSAPSVSPPPASPLPVLPHPIPFTPVRLNAFGLDIIEIPQPGGEPNQWLDITFEGAGFAGSEGIELRASLSLNRLVAPVPEP